MIQSFRKAVHPVQVHAKKQMRAPQIRFSTQRFFKCRNSLRKFVLQMPDKAQALPDLRLVSYGQIVFICFFRTPKVTGGFRATGGLEVGLRGTSCQLKKCREHEPDHGDGQ